MFPSESIVSNTLSSLLFYTVCLGMLLLIGVLIRVKVNFIRKLFIPASLIAGFIGLVLGPHVLGLLPDEMMSTWSGFSGVLISIVFAPMLIGVTINFQRIKETQTISQLIFSWNTSFLQWGVPLVITAILLVPLFGVNPLFGALTEIGWSGGHGTAGGMVESFNELNWAAGGSLGLTIATIGLLFGIISGVIIINYGVRKGYTNYLTTNDSLGTKESKDIYEPNEQTTSSVRTIRNEVVDGFAFHFSLIGVAIFIGWILKGVIDNFITGMPLFPLAMIGGFLVGLVLKRTSLYHAIDTSTFRRIQGISLDFLITAAVATISIPVVLEYFWPLLIITIVTMVMMVCFFFYFGPRLFQKDWFEHSIILFGTACGVAAIGYMLLRMVDPDLKSDAFIAYGLRAPFSSPFAGGGLVTSLIPVLTVAYGALVVGFGSIAIMIVIFVIAKAFGLYGRHENTYFINR
ncbi:sodium/glutamate symporter [Oceanobacillus halophilus]|uniref:Sodium:glutamate symporter n=1 Tax=Oceanobacillus halophilus TaxID=930130 RepID=A0A494ZS76_9BACI|nr:sodium/glutamate symporter [Oceanobacillus halophilus]RKQ28682.1 sodium:glutamate symporter [Oceanobacillus halophilus]